ncbi:hypothetical protein G9C85_06180 [Halorubellus sp. JP-L1]|uniref:hypothetical protein n=1 Tax=Halorubellus sp. JP-L1 TaxID=2715753 RepID=UPI00140B249C|nr:hypothetical protein [Halorubellus sp. JP-L1]NHN41225.1 hypothetical protein [Halorubellus sp. JP-L1]
MSRDVAQASSRSGDDRFRHSVDDDASDGDASDDDGSLTGPDGSIDRDAVLAAAMPVLERWERERSLDAIRGRVRNVLVASALVLAVTYFFDPGGLTGLVFQVWTLASLPVAAASGAVYATLRDPTRAKEVWWDSGFAVALGLVVIAAVVRSSATSPYARVAWQLLFGEQSPTGMDYGYDVEGGVDDARVAEIREYARWAVLGTIGVVALDVGGRLLAADGGLTALLDLVSNPGTGGVPGGGGAGGGGLPALPSVPTDPLSVVALVVAAVVVGSIVGLFVALRRDL